MMKSQTKISNINTNIRKIAKGLNRFTIEDILEIFPYNVDEIYNSINKLIDKNIIKKISESQYLNIDSRVQAKLYESPRIDNNEWLSTKDVAILLNVDEDTVLKRCKNKLYISRVKIVNEIKSIEILNSSLPTRFLLCDANIYIIQNIAIICHYNSPVITSI